VSDVDASLVERLRHDFGERSLPAVVSVIMALRHLDDDSFSSLLCLDAASVNSVSQQHSFTSVDNFVALFLDIIHTMDAHSSGQTAAKRRRYDDDVNNFASSPSAATYLQQDQSWNSAVDYHKHPHH